MFLRKFSEVRAFWGGVFQKLLPFALVQVLFFGFCSHLPESEDEPKEDYADLIGEPAGSDAFSSSTNFSGKLFDSAFKADALAGADYIGAPKINHYGAISLQYSFEVPPGRLQMAPQISAAYSSSAGESWLGKGWSLGLGSIQRETKYGELYYDHRDSFSYGGRRLVKVSGPAESEDGEYRAEIEEGSFMKFVLSDSENGGVWTIYENTGAVTLFGESLSHRVYRPDDPHKSYSWSFSRKTDRNGNYMYALYDEKEYAQSRVLYLKEIRYTGNDAQKMPAKQFVRFHLKPRENPYVSKTAGFTMKMEKLLDRVEMGTDGLLFDKVLWSYQMIYQLSGVSGKELLKSIDSSRKVTRPQFNYENSTVNFAWRQVDNLFASDPEINPQATRYFEGDFNGDGISDLCFFNPETGLWKVAESHHSGQKVFRTWAEGFAGLSGTQEIVWFKGNVTGDYDGNSKSDIAFYLPAQKEFMVAQSDGQRFEFRSYGRLEIDFDLFGAEWFPGDYDANGVSDVILFDEKNGSWVFMRNTGGAFSFVQFAAHFRYLYRNDYAPGDAMNGAFTHDENSLDRSRVNWFGGDYNADGRSDIAFYDERDGKWWVAENYRDDALGFRLEWKLYQTFNAPQQALFAKERFSGDFNDDGFSDFLLFDRGAGEWWLGAVKEDATGSPFVDFYRYSTMPQFKEITRWLQGDFNGDGRIDIGFYSQSDNNFWIGESTRQGFRYRVYSNLDYGGPDSGRVMAAPLPQEEVQIETRAAWLPFVDEAVPSNSGSLEVGYSFDANTEKTQGELAFAGCFTTKECRSEPEILIFDKKSRLFRLKKGASEIIELPKQISFSPGSASKIITQKRAWFNKLTGRHELILYEAGERHLFWRLVYDTANSLFQKKIIADFAFTGGPVTSFNIEESLSLFQDFDNDGALELLILDDLGGGEFYLFDGTHTPLVHSGYEGGFKNLFSSTQNRQDRSLRRSFQSFSGDFDGNGSYEVLLYSTKSGAPRWHLGQVSLAQMPEVVFAPLAIEGAGTLLPPGEAEFSALHRAVFVQGLSGESIFYLARTSGRTQLHRVVVSTGAINSVTLSGYTPFAPDQKFHWEMNHENRWIITDPGGAKLMSLSGLSYSLESLAGKSASYSQYEISRPDLFTKVYPYQWIQGDYNGDSKTDIGIFHLKEPKWYYALSTGESPDLMVSLKNGIGGEYLFEYANSSSFDNTGDDNISDLSSNYKVCTKLTLRDGMGHEYFNRYEYSGAEARSAHIEGKREVDFFGFSKFVTTDPQGSKTTEIFHSYPYSNFLWNRALQGAIKERRFMGYDGKEYEKTVFSYALHEIRSGSAVSYLVYQNSKQDFLSGVLTKTSASQMEVLAGEYHIRSKTEQMTDHFSDAAHPEETISAYVEYEYLPSTNRQREIKRIDHRETPFEMTTTMSYDGRGNLIFSRRSYTGSGLPSVPDEQIAMEYDGFGNKIAEIDQSDTPHRRKEISFDPVFAQFPIEVRQPGDHLVLTEKMKYDYTAAFGKLVSKSDANSNRVYYQYDSYGRLAAEYTDTEQGKKQLVSYEYANSPDFPLSAKTTQYTGSAPFESRLFVDGLGRKLHSIQSAGDVAGKRYVKTGKTVYDSKGRVIKKSQSDWAEDKEIDLYLPHRSEKFPTLTSYDAAGRVLKVMTPSAYPGEPETSVRTFYEDPWRSRLTHSIGTQKRVTKNGRGKLISTEESNVHESSLRASAGFCYDLNSNMIQKSDTNNSSLSCPRGGFFDDVPALRDASGNNKTYLLYDAFGRLRKSNDPDMGKNITRYNGFGEIIMQKSATEEITTFEYDSLGRLVRKRLPGKEGEVIYQYDMLAGSKNSLGRLVALEDQSQRKEFSYDMSGRRNKERRALKKLSSPFRLEEFVETSFLYDLAGRIEKIVYPYDTISGTQKTVCYEYESSGMATSVLLSALPGDCDVATVPVVSKMTYNEFGQIETISRGNGVKTLYHYDIKGRITRLLTTLTKPEGGEILQDRRYTYQVNNAVSAVESLPVQKGGASQVRYEYSYDGLNRLVGAKGEYRKNGLSQTSELDRLFFRSYAYAPNGNLVRKEFRDFNTGALNESWNYSYQNHRVNSIRSSQGVRFQLKSDLKGNTVRKIDFMKSLDKTMVFDSRNRVRQVLDSKTGEVYGSYFYDDRGFRVRRRAKKQGAVSGTVMELRYHNRYFAQERHYSGSTELSGARRSVNNIYLRGVRIAAVSGEGLFRYYLADQVDSVTVVTNGRGEVLARTEYYPYGEKWSSEGESSHHPKFNGQELDSESKNYYFNARHYDPEIGRFLTADTAIDGSDTTAGWNRYMYVHGNPIMYKDPTGHARHYRGGLLGVFGEIYRAIAGKEVERPGVASGSMEVALAEEARAEEARARERARQQSQEVEPWTTQQVEGGINRSLPYRFQYKNKENPDGTCNVTSLAMVMNKEPMGIYNDLVGQGKDIEVEENLRQYLEANGYKSRGLIGSSVHNYWARRRGTSQVSETELYRPSAREFQKIREALDRGDVILYHFGNKSGNWHATGHYGVLKGYRRRDDGSYDYIFHDPAGDRRIGYGKNSGAGGKGKDVHYSQELLHRTGIKGNLYWVRPKPGNE